MEGPILPDERYEFMGEIVLDVTDMRFAKVARSKDQYTIETVSEGRFIVRKDPSVYYVGLDRTKVIRASCNCPDWRFNSRKRKVPCKHIWLAAEATGLVQFPPPDLLPEPGEDDGDEGDEEDEEAVQGDGEVDEIDISGN